MFIVLLLVMRRRGSLECRGRDSVVAAGSRGRRRRGGRRHERGVVVAVGVDNGRLTRSDDFIGGDQR